MQNKLKKTKKLRGLTITLALAFLALIAVILLISSSLNIYFRLQTQEKVINGQQQFIAQKAADAVNNYILQKFSELEGGVRLGALGSAGQEEEKLTMERLLGLEPAFRQLALLNAQGQELIKVTRLSSFASSKLTELIGDHLLLEASKEKKYISSIYIDNVTSEPMTLMTVPIKDVFDDFKGILVAELNLKFMWDLVDSIQVGDTGVAYVVTKEGNLIAFGDTSRVLKGENLLHLDEVYEFAGENESIHESKSEISKGIRGDDVVTTHVPLGNPDWAVVVELPVEEAYADVNQELRLSAFVISLCIVLAIMISIYLSKRITKPVITLKKVALDIGRGNLNAKIDVKSKDEIGELASSFNKMVHDLKESRDKLIGAQKNLEKKVEERTKELVDSKRKIEQQNIQLRKMDELKTVFLNITSHELRTPITTIKGYAQMLLKQGLGEFTEEQKKSLDVVLRNANRLDRLIEDILDISRLQSGTMKFISTKSDIKKVVDETVESLYPYEGFKEITIHTDVEEGVPQLFIDNERVKQVITNLVNNAIKFSPNGSIINVKVKKDKEDVLFEVQDHGRGIPKDKQDKVFNLFYQVDAGVDRKFGGAGLGLAISRYIVMAHGGRIWVESKEGKGSNFKFTVPVKPINDLESNLKVRICFQKNREKTGRIS